MHPAQVVAQFRVVGSGHAGATYVEVPAQGEATGFPVTHLIDFDVAEFAANGAHEAEKFLLRGSEGSPARESDRLFPFHASCVAGPELIGDGHSTYV